MVSLLKLLHWMVSKLLLLYQIHLHAFVQVSQRKNVILSWKCRQRHELYPES